MSSKKRSAFCSESTNVTDFLSMYFNERGISFNEENTASAECIRRAVNARERFKLIPVHTPEVSRADVNNFSPPLTAEQKYTRRLLNNRKSASAARVYQEVLMNEQAHSLDKVIDERDRVAAELKHAIMEREIIARELDQIRALVRQLQNSSTLEDSQIFEEPLSAGHFAMHSAAASTQLDLESSSKHENFFGLSLRTRGDELLNVDFGQSEAHAQNVYDDLHNTT